MHDLDAILEEVRAEYAPDPRLAIFEVSLESRPDGVAVRGETTETAALEAFLARASDLSGVGALHDEVMRLPDREPGSPEAGLIRAALAPVHAKPRVSATQVTQLVLGETVELLRAAGPWWRVRAEDGYIGWVHHGYLEAGAAAWARDWVRGEGGEPVVSLGAELADDEDRIFARPPWGSRLIRSSGGRLRVPDGRRGVLAAGEIVELDRRADRFPARGESLARTARRWLGTPYVWGGVTPGGADCSGFVQAVFRMHGVALPRDSDQQAGVGSVVESDAGFDALHPGDLLFFAERPGRITHVGISLGGAHLVHCSLSNGGVDLNDLEGDRPGEAELRRIFVQARRPLPR